MRAFNSTNSCHISRGNSAFNGGGIFVDYKISGKSHNCTISHNTASSSGGGMYNEGGSHVFEDAVFSNNQALTGGAITFVMNKHNNSENEFVFNSITAK